MEKQTCAETLERYWQLFEVPLEHVCDAAALVFTEHATWESERLDKPVQGRESIVQHIQLIRQVAVNGDKSRSDVEYGELSAQWDWTVTRADGSTISGTDRVDFAADRRIESIRIIAR